VEANHDADGIIWPYALAPYQVLVMPLNMGLPKLVVAAETIYAQLAKAGFEVLLDDREERGGVKFKDADLIGIPLQVIVGERGIKKGTVEVKVRRSGERFEVAPEGLAQACRDIAAS
jgi:prolyl-tRNA synthetase